MSTTQEIIAFARGDHVKADGYSGVAWWVIGPEVEAKFSYPSDPEWYDDEGEYFGPDGSHPEDWEEVPTGRLTCVMVGDDREFHFDPEDLTKIDRDDFCGECGQIGCGHG